jgi:hypothetical protein
LRRVLVSWRYVELARLARPDPIKVRPSILRLATDCGWGRLGGTNTSAFAAVRFLLIHAPPKWHGRPWRVSRLSVQLGQEGRRGGGIGIGIGIGTGLIILTRIEEAEADREAEAYRWE